MEAQKHEELKFTYRKGRYFRMIHVDGAVGGIAPTGRYIHMTLWNERKSIPREQVFDILDDGLAPTPKHTKDIGGVFRELEACIILDIETATRLRHWLDHQLSTHHEVSQKISDKLKSPDDAEDGSDE